MVKLKKNGNYVEMWCEPTPYLESVRGNGTLFTSSVGIRICSISSPDISKLDRVSKIFLCGDDFMSDDFMSTYHINKYSYEDIVKSFTEFEVFKKGL